MDANQKLQLQFLPSHEIHQTYSFKNLQNKDRQRTREKGMIEIKAARGTCAR